MGTLHKDPYAFLRVYPAKLFKYIYSSKQFSMQAGAKNASHFEERFIFSR